MKRVLLLTAPALLLIGCSGDAAPSEKEGAAAQSNFNRPMTDAEKPKSGNGAPSGVSDPMGKKPVGG